jgi:iron complex transport system substrate-binding protein
MSATPTHRSRARWFRPAVIALALCFALLAAACSSDEGSSDGDDTAGGSGGAAYPVTIEHKFGTTEIPATPERVVSLGYTEQDSIVLFGVQPIAVRYAFGPEGDVYFPWTDGLVSGPPPEILPRAEVNFEQIASLEPDLIMAVTAGLTEKEYDTLAEIAPVVVQPEQYPDFGTPWQVQTELAGKVFAQEDRAAEVVADVEAQFEAVRAEHPEFEGLGLALSGPAYEAQYPFHASSDTRTRFFLDLGFVVPPELDEIAGDEFYGALSKEQAALLDTDVIVWQSGSAEERAGIESDPILAGLPAVADGRSIFIEGSDYDALQFSSALSLPFLLENFVPKLTAVIEPS